LLAMSLESPAGTDDEEVEGVGADEARGLSEESGLWLETFIDPLGLWEEGTPPIIPIIPAEEDEKAEGWPYIPKEPPDTAE
jgi:hypothetical protein